jgi:hypothetical protein
VAQVFMMPFVAGAHVLAEHDARPLHHLTQTERSVRRLVASRRSLRNPIRCLDQAAIAAAKLQAWFETKEAAN